MTEKEFKELVEKIFKDLMGGTPEEFRRETIKAMQEADKSHREEQAKVRQQAAEERNTLVWDPTDAKHPYMARAGAYVRNDHIRVQRAFVKRGPDGKSPYAAEGRGLRLARYARARAIAQKEGVAVASILKGWGDEWMVKEFDQAIERDVDAADRGVIREKAMGVSTPSAGGLWVPTEYSTEMIELLRAASVVRSTGIMQRPMPKGQLTLRKATSAATAAYLGESGTIASTSFGTGLVMLLAKKLAAQLPLSNELMNTSDVSMDQYVRNELIEAMALREDQAFLRGDGTSNTPKGLRYMAASANVVAAATAATDPADDTIQDMRDIMTGLLASNVRDVPVLILNPRTRVNLWTLKMAGGDYFVWRDEMAGGTILGMPWFETTTIPANLGGGSDTEILAFTPRHTIIGDTRMGEIEVTREASYTDGGSLVSAWERDETVFRIISESDIVETQSGNSIYVKTGVTY